MNAIRIAAIVEGHGETQAVPLLLRRLATLIDPSFVPEVLPPLRIPASSLLRHGEIERAVELASRKLGGHGGIFVLVDCDWEGGCPARDGPSLLRRATTTRPDMPVAVVLARMEFEAWFLAAAESLRGKRGLPFDLSSPTEPETIRNAKGWLSNRMPPGRSYVETEDQAALTAVFDLDMARRSDSFDKCYRAVRTLLTQIRQQA